MFSAVLICGALTSSPSEENFWTGTWKLNEAKSSPPSASFVTTITPQGDYQVLSSDYRYTFRCDGREYPTTLNRTISCVRPSELAMNTISKEKGKQVSSTHRTLSPNGTTLRSETVLVHQDGSKETKVQTYLRMDATKGFAGAWRDVDSAFDRPKLLVLNLTGTHLTITFPQAKQSTEIVLRGADAPTHGLPASVHVSLSAKVDSPLMMSTVQKRDGVPIRDGSLILSSDGHILVEETWRPGISQIKSRLVYGRQ